MKKFFSLYNAQQNVELEYSKSSVTEDLDQKISTENKAFKDKKILENLQAVKLDRSNYFDYVTINLASPLRIRSWAEKALPTGCIVGEVLTPDTFNYRSFKPEMAGLFCERIFGPLKSWECHCKKYSFRRVPGKICEVCGVELTEARVRRYRMGFIEFVHPVAHLWFLKAKPSYLSLMLDRCQENIESYIYSTVYPGHDRPCCNKKQKGVEITYDRLKFQGNKTVDFDEDDELSSLETLIRILDEDYESHKRILDMEATELDSTDLDLELDLQRLELESDPTLELDAKVKLDSNTMITNSTYNPRFVSIQRFLQRSNSGAILVKQYLESLNLKEEIYLARLNLAFPKKKTWLDNLNQKKVTRSLNKKDFSNFEKLEYTFDLKRELRRLRLLESFYSTQTDPSWMILTCFPVLPPDLRPMMELSGGQIVSSDLNDLYRSIINRNNRLFELLCLGSLPNIILDNEKRLLQEAVDCLIDNDKVDEQALSYNDRPLKSLAEVIEGKYGRFRQNLLGKRVDYSGRSVIIVGPELRLTQCGLPFDMITELFQCTIIDTLVRLNIARNKRVARFLVQEESLMMLLLVSFLLQDEVILLNRAPTLHRLGVQAFDPILIPGQAIQLHPLVCSAFNADFDGDQMGVHVPLSMPSKLESKYLMRPSYHLISPANGFPVIKPAQDMVIGCYYLTLENNYYSHLARAHYFSSASEVILALSLKKVSLHLPIWIRYYFRNLTADKILNLPHLFTYEISDEYLIAKNQQLQLIFEATSYQYISSYLRTTPGRVIFNDATNNSHKF